jgi:hypothetical protein
VWTRTAANEAKQACTPPLLRGFRTPELLTPCTPWCAGTLNINKLGTAPQVKPLCLTQHVACWSSRLLKRASTPCLGVHGIMVAVSVLAHIQPLQSRPDGVRGDPQMSVGKQLKQILDIDSSVRIGYLAHVRGPAPPAQQ